MCIRDRLQVAISVLTDELALLKSDIAQVKSSSSTSSVWQSSAIFGDNLSGTNMASAASDAVPSVPKSLNNSDTATRNNIISLVERTVRDSKRRKRNVIISGLPERSDIDDRTSFLNICSEHLSVKPYLSTDSCIRIGKANLNQPWRLLVWLSCKDTASELLMSAKKLRNCDDSYVANSVYINQDLSPTEAKLAFERREKRRRQQSLSTRASVDQPVNTVTSVSTGDTEHAEQSESGMCSSSKDSTPTIRGSTSIAEPESDGTSVSVAVHGSTIGAESESGLDPTAQPFRSSH